MGGRKVPGSDGASGSSPSSSLPSVDCANKGCGQDVAEPDFLCYCGNPARILISDTPWNPGGKFLVCRKRGYNGACKLWIWEDVVMRFVQDMVDFCAATTHDCLHEQLSIARESLLEMENKFVSLQKEAEARELELTSSIHELESRLRGQVNWCRTVFAASGAILALGLLCAVIYPF